jgi:hypothetical protein
MSDATDEPYGGLRRPYSSKTKAAFQPRTRRAFLITLGAGATAAITGYFLTPPGVPPCPDPAATPSDAATRPRLKADAQFGADGDLTTLRRTDADGPVLCAVNTIGERVLTRLDGRHTIEEIAEALACGAGTPRAKTLEAGVAAFVAELGSLGFLEMPFYVYLYEEKNG